VTLANGNHGGNNTIITLKTANPIAANVVSQDNIDFGATQKASIETATDAAIAASTAIVSIEADAAAAAATAAKLDTMIEVIP
jgi:hypothetical protein